MANKLGINSFDLTPALAAAARKLSARDEFPYWKDDGHLNPAGNKILADMVYKQISRNGNYREKTPSGAFEF